jgi:preprotein translocase subunit SecA
MPARCARSTRCGLRLASITGQVDPAGRHRYRYDADVVYLTAKELLADHLRDWIGPEPARIARDRFAQWLDPRRPDPGARCALVRGLHTAIVDEADSVLIDEAVTPLILAAPHERRRLDDAVRRISALADSLAEGRELPSSRRASSRCCCFPRRGSA